MTATAGYLFEGADWDFSKLQRIAAFGANWSGRTTSGSFDPNIEVVDVDLADDRRLMLRHAVVKGAQLNEADARRVLQHLADLWSYDVSLVEVDATDTILKEYVVGPHALAAAA